MSINKTLDYAIMLQETAEHNIKAGYQIGDKRYDNYLDNVTWKVFVEEMKKCNPIAYKMFSNGGGKELNEREVGMYVYPPKMASFGSSSRMIYNLMKNTPGFMFEQKLPTTVGGIANLDGFMEMEGKCVFVEAKCREPYTGKEEKIDMKYESLYRMLTSVDCKIQQVIGKKMQVAFSVKGKAIQYFDIKQMICHLLGVATAYLKGVYDKKIDFVYLLYNPTMLEIENANHRKNICNIYQSTCEECACVDFKKLFYEILCYLQQYEKIGTERNACKIAEQFSFRMCDQFTMRV